MPLGYAIARNWQYRMIHGRDCIPLADGRMILLRCALSASRPTVLRTRLSRPAARSRSFVVLSSEVTSGETLES